MENESFTIFEPLWRLDWVDFDLKSGVSWNRDWFHEAQYL